MMFGIKWTAYQSKGVLPVIFKNFLDAKIAAEQFHFEHDTYIVKAYEINKKQVIIDGKLVFVYGGF